MKKLVVVLRSAQLGGVENHAYDILANARGFGFEPILISLVNLPVAEKFEKLGINIYVLNDQMHMSFNTITTIYPLAKLLKNISPDIIHLHGTRPTFIGSIASRLAGVRHIVSTLHGSPRLMAINKTTGTLDYRLWLISKFIHIIGLLLSEKIIIDAEALLREMQNLCRGFPLIFALIKQKTVLVHIGINIPKQDTAVIQDLRQRLGIKAGVKLVGTIGRLDEPMKGVSFLLEASKLLLDRGCKFELVIAGKGDSEQILKALSIRLGINHKVHFLGYWEDLREIYKSLDIFVLPSLSEGFPIVNLEAMAFKLPVIASNVGGVREAVRNLVTGIIVPPGDAIALSDAIGFLLNNEQIRIDMGLNSYRRYEKQFTDMHMLGQIFSLYDDLLRH